MKRRSAEGLAGGLLLIAASASTRAHAESATGRLLLGVTLNGRDLPEPVVVLRSDGRFLAGCETVRAWRLLVPRAAEVVVEGAVYVDLRALPGVSIGLDEARQALRIDAAAEAFEATQLGAGPGATSPAGSPPITAAFLNYDLSAEAAGGGAGATAFIEAAASGGWGLFTSRQLASAGSGAGAGAVRLETSYVRDDPARLRRVSLGDGLTHGADWAAPARFAGVRYGTAFDLQPTLVTFPTPTFFGRTALPSSVELYVNEVLRYQGEVDAGPFSVSQVPVVTGAGQVALQVRDALGVQRAVQTSYYVSSALLRPGLRDFSVEAGAERRGYGVSSFDYGPAFAAASLRQGLSERVTLEARAEAGASVQDAGFGAHLLVGGLGEATAALAVSQSAAGAGGLVRAGFNRISPRWTVSALYERATDRFRQVGSGGSGEDAPIRQVVQLAAGASLGSRGDLSASYTDLRQGQAPRVRVASLSYSLRVAGRAFLNLLFLHSRAGGGRTDTRLTLAVTVPLGARASASAQADSRSQSAELRVDPPTDRGLGARLITRTGEGALQEADLTWRSEAAEATVQAAHGEGSGVRLLVSGGVLAAGGRVTPTRRLDGGFAVVETPGVSGVEVSLENRPVAHTDRSGVAIVTGLRPNEANKISIAAGDLPIEARLDTDVRSATPAFLGGVRTRFGVVLEHPALLELRDETGALLEAGSLAHVDGGEALRVGFDGELFAPSLHAGSVIQVERWGGACRITAPPLPPGGGVPRIGPLTCRSYRRAEA